MKNRTCRKAWTMIVPALTAIQSAAQSTFKPYSVLFFLLWAFLPSSIGLNAAQSGDFTYEIAGSTLTITRYTGPGGTVIIPGTVAGMPVTGIVNGAFNGCTGLTSVTIPNSVTSIGEWAFAQCTELTNVVIPNSATSIGHDAFWGCTGLTSVMIGDSVTSIGYEAFWGCTGLTSVTIPNSVTSIDSQAFQGCTGLSAITVDALNPSYSSTDGVWFSKRQDILIQYPGGKVGSYTIPNSVTSIDSQAFQGCTELTTVTIPNSVTGIAVLAFAGCTGLTTVTIPNGRIGGGAFLGCTGLTSVTIGNSVTSIFAWAFADCTGLTSVTIPNSMTDIGAGGVFAGCTGLISVTIPNSVTSIGPVTFKGCTGLTSVYFKGNAPETPRGIDIFAGTLFSGANRVIVYYRAGTKGWSTTFAGRPTAIWADQPSYSEWAQSFGLATRYPDASGEQEDADQDGLKNIQEMAAGTDPANAKSVLAIEQQPRPGDLIDGDKTPAGPDQFALHFQTIPGKPYEIQSTDLFGTPWKTEAIVIASTTQKRVLLNKSARSGFYRVLLRQ